MTTNTVLLQLLTLAVVLESDLGTRRVGWFRVARPVIALAAVVPFFLSSLPTTGGDPSLQVGGALAGVVLGLISVSPTLVAVRYDPLRRPARFRARRRVGAVVSHAGLGYAGIWVGVTAARLAFSWGADHVFGPWLGRFMPAHQLSPAGLGNAMIFWALGMGLARSLVLVVRARGAHRSWAIALTATRAGAAGVPVEVS